MKMYYLEDSIDNLMEEDCESREEAIEVLEKYFSSFRREEVLELLIRGQIHANEDKRTKLWFER